MHLILPYFIILIIIFQLLMKKNSKKTDKRNADFFDKVSRANSTRKKDISGLDYITIPDSILNMTSDIPDVEKALEKLKAFSSLKLLNLTGYSNTDLKLEYGVANLTTLSQYDDNCTRMLRCIVNLASALSDNRLDADAVTVLEFGIGCGTDITANYTMLAGYYLADNNKDGVSALIEKANSINSLTKDSIVKKLSDMLDAA